MACSGRPTQEVTSGLTGEEPAQQNQGRSPPGEAEAGRGGGGGVRRATSASVALTGLGKELDSTPGALGSQWRVASREGGGFTFKKTTLPR